MGRKGPGEASGVTGRLDYFRVTIFLPGHIGHAEVQETASTGLLGLPEGSECFTPRGHASKGYAEVLGAPIDGVFLHRHPTGGGAHCSLELKGQACEALPYERLQGFLIDLTARGYKWRASRVDVAFDGVPFSPAQVRDAWLAGRVRTRIHPASYDWRSNAEGDTFYYGKASSGRVVRVYDRRGPTRIELEARSDRAELLGGLLATLPERDFLSVGAADLVAAAEFLAPHAGVAPWWRPVIALSGLASPCRLARRQPSLSAPLVIVTQARERLTKLLGQVAVLAAGLCWTPATVADAVAGFTVDDPESAATIRRIREALGALGASP